MNEYKPNIYTQKKKFLCDWTDKKKYLIQYRMLNIYVRHGMVVDEVHKIISFRQTMWLKN